MAGDITGLVFDSANATLRMDDNDARRAGSLRISPLTVVDTTMAVIGGACCTPVVVKP